VFIAVSIDFPLGEVLQLISQHAMPKADRENGIPACVKKFDKNKKTLHFSILLKGTTEHRLLLGVLLINSLVQAAAESAESFLLDENSYINYTN